MRRALGLALVALVLLAGCDEDSEGPVFPVKKWLYDWVEAPGSVDPLSDRAPVLSNPIVTFRLARGERRSALRAGTDWPINNVYLMGYDVRLDRATLGSEKLTLSRFMRRGGSDATIGTVQLDARNGVTVFGRQCIAPKDLGTWHRVEFRIMMSNTDSGYFEVFCDRKPVWARTALRTTLPPVCRRSEGCTTPVPSPIRFEWGVGLFSDRRVRRDVTVEMRQLHYRRIFYVPGRVGNL